MLTVFILIYSCWHIKSSTSPYNNTALLPLIVLGTNKQAGVGGNPRKQKSYSFIHFEQSEAVFGDASIGKKTLAYRGKRPKHGLKMRPDHSGVVITEE